MSNIGLSAPDAARVPAARRRRLLDFLSSRGSASIGELAAQLGVSNATVHRDLRALEAEAALQRVQGGATARDLRTDAPYHVESAWTRRVQVNKQAKLAAAVNAAALVQDGETIFLDGSTTSLALAAVLESQRRAITLVTTSPAIAQSISAPQMRVISAPGLVDQELRIISGSWTNQFLSQLHFQAAFISAAGVSHDGVIYSDSHEIQVTVRLVLERAHQKVCVIDASKVGHRASLELAQLHEVDVLALDRPVEGTAWAASAPHTRVLDGENHQMEFLPSSALWRSYFA